MHRRRGGHIPGRWEQQDQLVVGDMTVSINSMAAQGVSASGDGKATGHASGGGIIPMGSSAALAGGAIPQAGGVGSILKKALVGAAAGAAAGAGYGLLAGAISFLPTVTVPMGALIGAGAGAVMGIVKGVMDNRKATLALQSAQAQQVQTPVVTTQPSAAPTGPTYKPGETGDKVRNTQRMLKTLGMYTGRVNGKMDEKTVASIKRYELMKGAAPTGLSTPEVRQAISADAKLANRYA